MSDTAEIRRRCATIQRTLNEVEKRNRRPVGVASISMIEREDAYWLAIQVPWLLQQVTALLREIEREP